METPSFLEPSCVAYFCNETGLQEDRYLDAFKELETIFPHHEAREYADAIIRSEGGLGGPFDLHPLPFHYLTRHPLWLFMSGRITDYWILAEAVQFGLALLETREIPKVKSLRNRLKKNDEYLSVLFEIEVLATLQRSGMSPEIHETPDFLARTRHQRFQIEAKHRGVPFSRAIAQKLILLMASYEFGELTINLTNLGGKGEDAGETAAAIADKVTTALAVQKSIGAIEEPIFTELFVHLPSKGRKTIAFVDGTKDHDEQVRRVVSGALREKDSQIGRSTCKDAVGIIALDCRSLFPALPPPDKRGLVARGWLDHYEPRIKLWTASVIGESQSFLATATNTRGVLIWFRNQARGLVSKLSEYLQCRDTICLVSRDAVMELSANTLDIDTMLAG